MRGTVHYKLTNDSTTCCNEISGMKSQSTWYIQYLFLKLVTGGPLTWDPPADVAPVIRERECARLFHDAMLMQYLSEGGVPIIYSTQLAFFAFLYGCSDHGFMPSMISFSFPFFSTLGICLEISEKSSHYSCELPLIMIAWSEMCGNSIKRRTGLTIGKQTTEVPVCLIYLIEMY